MRKGTNLATEFVSQLLLSTKRDMLAALAQLLNFECELDILFVQTFQETFHLSYCFLQPRPKKNDGTLLGSTFEQCSTQETVPGSNEFGLRCWKMTF